MIRTLISLFAALCLVTGLGRLDSRPAWAEDGRTSVNKPGRGHDRLNALVGDWKMTIKVWKSPESEATKLKGTATRRWVLGRRFVEEHSENKTSGGGRFRAIAYLGYNNQNALYERFWMTNGSTGMFTERGRYDPDANLIRLQGAEAGSDGSILTTSELKIESPKRHVFTAYVTDARGVRWKQLQIVYRKK